ncbi:MDR/zinc-dependent alcohol dehydrogenase-like family protein [Xanthomonas sacchari]|uniref:MDR/zinc-dependent alcohol dehydrogenase-like family protein n=1 Tax=Xanthomonas sacchari TaxID=56458 RepID=UPI00224E0544|nr:zinc-binding dehydrogenase [Xanthomonas sacchari]MCW0403341.1 putative zinc-type alcohol dehydrogenase-like protein YdjJ [Xanthomonas sacchari]MCW0423881.1 putative zinc-type alcohol dehydrogenase-like protein YdjJ [Xanthomonas sacchari]
MNSMHAAVFEGPGRIVTQRQSRPEPAPQQVRVRLQGCGVCASNLPVWAGRPWFAYPFEPGAPGHEGWGEIDAVGAEVQGWAPGDRVALLSGRAYAEYDLAETDALVRLPPALDGRDLPGEPLACAMNILRRSDIRPGQTVAVVGVGFIGALLIQLATGLGAQVIALSRRDYALQVARQCGASATLATEDRYAAIGAVHELTGGSGCLRVIEAAGEQVTLDIASALCGEGGRLVIAGYHQDGPRQVDMQQWNWRGLDVVNAHERDPRVALRGLQEAVEAVADGRLDPFPLLTHRYALDRLPQAFADMEARPEGFLKGVVLA